MSVRQVQIERILEEIVRHLYSTGIKPTLTDIMREVSEYFAQYPVGQPIPLSLDSLRFREVANHKDFNKLLANTTLNLDVLYETAIDQVDDIKDLTSALQGHLQRLKVKRKKLESVIDDYLLSLYNTDGYFYSVSDTFSDLSNSDLNLTSAHIDVETGAVQLPAVSSLSTRLGKDVVSNPIVSVKVNNVDSTFTTIAPFVGALEDSLQNNIWAIRVITNSPSIVAAQLTVRLINGDNQFDVSRIEFDPYGVAPVQMLIETGKTGQENALEFLLFGNKVQKSTTKMVFSDDTVDIKAVRFSFQKDKYDYTSVQSGMTQYNYIFGAKDIGIYDRVFESTGIFVSNAIFLPEDLGANNVIDAVSLVVDEDVPSGTKLVYYIASEPDIFPEELSDLNWQKIVPIREGESTSNSIIRFDGVITDSRIISSDTQSADIPLLPLDFTNNDLRLRNPSPAVIPGVDVFRLATFGQDVIPTSLTLEEGVNTTRSYFIDLDEQAVDGIAFWVDKLADPLTHLAYGRVDVGNDFFYGGDIGEGDISVFTETFLYCDSDRSVFLSEFSKPDPFSQTWDVRVFLNGREIGFLPVGTNKAVLPWVLREGKNHVILLINIPEGKSPGTLKILGNANLTQYGSVKLGDYSYVDPFDLRYNQNGSQKTFSIINGEIVTRYGYSDSYRFTFSRPTNAEPTGVRVRVDLDRESNSPKVTPRLNSYRLRFSYGSEIQ